MTISPTPTDESLVARYAAGEADALEALVSRHFGPAYRLALRSLGDPGAAEDAASAALVSLVRSARTFDPSRAFRPWWGSVVLNAIRKEERRRRTRARHERVFSSERRGETGPRVRPDVDLEACLEVELVGEHVARLDPEVREAVLLHFWDGRTHAEVATLAGCPRGTASSRIRRGLEQLRESLTGAGFSLSVEELGTWLAKAPRREAALGTPPAPSGPALEARAVRLARRALGVKLASVALVAVALGTGLTLARGASLSAGHEPEVAAVTPDGPPATGKPPADAAPSPASPGPAPAGSPRLGASPAPETPATATAKAPASSAAASPGDASLLDGEPEGPAPTYPWATPDKLDKLLAGRFSVNHSGTPLSFCLETFTEMTGGAIQLDPEAGDLGDAPVTVHLRDSTFGQALDVIVGLVPGAAARRERDRIVVGRASDLPPGPPRPIVPSQLVEPECAKLVAVPLAVKPEDTLAGPLDRVLDTVRNRGGMDLVIAADVDEGKRATPVNAGTARSAAAILDAVLSPLGLGWEIRHEIVWVSGARPEPRRAPTALHLRDVGLELRGASVPEIVHALGERGVEAVATPEAWASLGTVALLASGTSLHGALADLDHESPLRAFVAEGGPGREVVVFTGSVPGAREAMTAAAPARFPGAVADVASGRAALAQALAARRAARADRTVPRVALLERELAVSRLAARLVALAARARELGQDSENLERLEGELARARDEAATAAAAAAELQRRLDAAMASGVGGSELWDECRKADGKRLAAETRVIELSGRRKAASREADLVKRLEAGAHLAGAKDE